MELIKIVGTSHIAKQSIEEINKAVREFKPDIIAVELDLPRASGLMSKEKSKVSLMEIRNIGILGFLFAKVGQVVQQKLGKMVGISPGSEMKEALNLAKQNKLQIALIDQPIKITLKNFSKQITWREKFRFVGDFFKGLIFKKQQIKELGLENLDLTKVPEEELIEKMVGNLKKRYPNLHKTLIADRNNYMVKKLVKLLRANPEKRILCVVGAGHKKEMEEMLLKVEIV